MQNKGLVKFFAILIALVSIYQLSFTFIGNKVKQDAKAFAKGDSQLELKYLDSIGKEKVFLDYFTFNEVQDKQIKKGLDLEGGINVILQISVKDILKGLSNNSQEPTFNKALETATKTQQGNEAYIDAFFRSFKEESKGAVKLASPDLFTNKIMGDEINFKMTDAQVEQVLRRKVDESVVSAFEVLRKRIDKFGVTQPNIQQLGNTGRILVELPGAKDVDRIKKLLQSTAQLEFWETFKIEEVGGYLQQVNEALKATENTKLAVTEVTKSDLDTLLVDKKKDSSAVAKNPIFDKMISFGGGGVVGVFAPKDTATIGGYLRRDNIVAMRPAELRYVKFVWGKPTTIENDKKEKIDAIELYALRGNRENLAPLSGGVITDAQATFDQLNRPAVTMQMNGEGARKWEELTGRAYQQKTNIAIVLDNVVYSAPGVSTGAIAGGRSEITGTFTVEETADLSNVLKAGKLPAAADIVQSDVVGPSLGQEAIDNGMLSFLIGMLAVVLWMILYYGKAGFVANISLLVNILFIFGILASLGAVLTLPGIAGIVLTIGMAVDANVIIYERSKEELREGKTLPEAIDAAFTWKGAMSSIFDANITTALTALILLVFGTGPIKGFATTLLIGIGTSLFTSIFITRILLDWISSSKHNITFDTPMSKNWFQNLNFDFLAKKKVAYAVSAVLLIASIGSLAVQGLNYGVDFEGGRTFQVRFDKKVIASEISSELTNTFGTTVEAKTFGTDNQLKITTKYKVKEEGEGVDKEVNELLFKGLQKFLPANTTYEKFITNEDGKQFGLLQSTKVGPTIAADIKTDSIYAVLGSLLVVFLYLLISFRKWQFGLGAVAAVAHDVIIVLGIYSIFWKFLPFNMEIDQAFIAAILTVIGYSLNDTVIVFDRVREYLDYRSSTDFKGLVNKALNTTLSRTINTSLTTLIVLIAIFVLGGETIRGFVFAILVGILVGTYSSLFIATPVMTDSLSEKEALKMAMDSKENA
ncbi:MAG: protein translocase subunit SecDF [Flavobacteriales bacterium]|nr:protein translocase subunit SecDF [Flavobacteriales bacterium]